MTEPEAGVTILDNDWPGRELPVMPGDLSKWLPQGLGLGAPLVATPYSAGPEPSYYGLDAPGPNPILSAPSQQPASGLLYFDDGADLAKLHAALEIMGVRATTKDYAVFWDATIDTIEDRYLHQVRIMSKNALAHFSGRNPRPGRCRSNRLLSAITSRRLSPSRRASGTTSTRSAGTCAERWAVTVTGRRSVSASASPSKTRFGACTGCGAGLGFAPSEALRM